MKSDKTTLSSWRKWFSIVILLIVPALLWAGQEEKKSTPPPSKPVTPAAHPPTSATRPGTPSNAATGTARPGTPYVRPGSPNPVRPGVSTPNSVRPNTRPGENTRTVSLPGGRGTAEVTRGSGGRVTSIHTSGMAISHPLHGPRTVVVEHNGRTIVAVGRGGYVQRPYLVRGNRVYVQRTYVVGGRTYVSVYRSYNYRGYCCYYGYAPAYYYHPVFYGWAFNPWVAPVYYGPAAWGWVGAPWYGYYGPFFTPYPVYPMASLWLTDYLIAANLQAAYQAQADANAAAAQQAYANGAAAQAQADASAAGGPPPVQSPAPASAGQTLLTPEVKQAIADEVKAQLAAEQAAAANPQAAPSSAQVPDALNPAERVFVVSSALNVTPSAGGQECALTPGDVVMRISDTPDANQNVTASVQSSKQADCGTGQTVAVGVQDLQEMHNQFRQQLDTGLKTLADNSGKGGLPKAPDTGTAAGEVPAPAPDPSAAAQLAGAQQDADLTEKAVQQSGSGS
jgi:hypothetical protein